MGTNYTLSGPSRALKIVPRAIELLLAARRDNIEQRDVARLAWMPTLCIPQKKEKKKVHKKEKKEKNK